MQCSCTLCVRHINVAFSRAVGPRKKALSSRYAWACETVRWVCVFLRTLLVSGENCTSFRGLPIVKPLTIRLFSPLSDQTKSRCAGDLSLLQEVLIFNIESIARREEVAFTKLVFIKFIIFEVICFHTFFLLYKVNEIFKFFNHKIIIMS